MTQSTPQAAAQSSVAIVCLKAFGDLVIARNALRGAGNRDCLIIGDHLLELNGALGPIGGVHVIAHGEGNVPALFDVRKAGLLRGVRSGLSLRRLFKAEPIEPACTLVFDQCGIRERFISGSRAVAALPAAENIYLAYRQLLPPQVMVPSGTRGRPQSPRVGIFPGSRMARKMMPASVISCIEAACAELGLDATVFALKGETVDIPPGVTEVVNVPRSFAAMADAVQSVSSVISADSMPAHLAEYFGVPVFVASPVDNRYWLPLSAFQLRRWGTFPDAALTASIEAFLRPPSPEPSPPGEAGADSIHVGHADPGRNPPQ